MHIEYDVYKDLAQERMERLKKEVRDDQATSKKRTRSFFRRKKQHIFPSLSKIRMKRNLKINQ